jgi:DNA polymerase-3 subunit delta'
VVPDDKGNISIDTVRNTCGRLALRASEGPTKVAVVLQADAMKPPAQNALLKTLEEPPGSTCFVMTTTRLRMLLSTVRSRCQTIRLAPRRREGAWRVLSQAGIDEEVARPLGALVGPDPERAQALLDKGAPEIIATLRSALAPGAPLPVIIEAAADLAADRERTDLALALIEVEVRDRLAHACGATFDHLLTQPVSSGSLQHLSAAASRLQSLRRFKTLNINRSVALETVLFTLAGRFRPLVPQDVP